MIQLLTPAVSPERVRRLPFYLALEEWVACHMPAGEYFFTWRVEPTVIFGRNQDVTKEVNLEYCRENGIQVYRRRSGGGCVYADMGNLMISYIAPVTDVEKAYGQYTHRLSEALRTLGLDVEVGGRNDISIDGHKFSGNALYRLPGRSIIHGTLLFDTNFIHMANAITPARAKLESHQVKSVESRITTLNQYLPQMDLDAVEHHLIASFSDGTYALDDEQWLQVEEIERHYYDLHWTFGHKGILGAPAHMARAWRRIDGAGTFDLLLTLADGSISGVELTGDFFMLDDLDTAIFSKIYGCKLDAEALAQALRDVDVSQTIRGLSTQAFIDLIMHAHLHKADLLKSPDIKIKS